MPNVAITLWDNYKLDPDKDFLAMAFPKIERYVEWDMQWGQVGAGGNGTVSSKYLLHWGNAGDAGMDHEQNFCPEGTYWHKGTDHWGHSCTANHFALDFANYIIWECQVSFQWENPGFLIEKC